MKKVISMLLSLLVGVVFYAFVLRPPSTINFIPFAIHQQFFSNIINEYVFILIFDILLVLFVAFVFHLFLRKNYINK
jgi:hypothetical protein